MSEKHNFHLVLNGQRQAEMMCVPVDDLRLASSCPLSTDKSFSSTSVESTGRLQASGFKPSPIMLKGES